MNFFQMENSEILRELGHRLRRERLNRNISQAHLADQVGIARRTLVSAEHGQSPTLETYLSIFRGLKLLDRFQLLLPEPTLSPVQLAKLKGRERKNASHKRKPTDSSLQSSSADPKPQPWSWNP